jgi:hypothetical protein
MYVRMAISSEYFQPALEVHSFEKEVSENLTEPAPKQIEKRYVVVDLKHGIIGLTTDSKLASTPKDIHRFLCKYLTTLETDTLQLIQHTIPEEILQIDKIKNPLLFKMVRCISTIVNFILNGGKTDHALINEVRSMANLEELFKKSIEENKMLTKLNRYIELRNTNRNDKSFNAIKEKLQETTYKKQMRSILRRFNISEDDSQNIKNAKNKVVLKNNSLFREMHTMTSVHFYRNIEIKVAANASDFSTKKTENEPRCDTFVIPTCFTNREDTLGDGNAPFLRAREDLSVRKFVGNNYRFSMVAPNFDLLLRKGATFEQLRNIEVNYLQLDNANRYKLAQMNIIPKYYLYFARTMEDFCQTLPNEKITTIEELKEAMKVWFRENNEKVVELDQEEFQILLNKKIKAHQENTLFLIENPFLFEAQDFKEAYDDFFADNWKDDEVKQIHCEGFTEEEAFDYINAVIDEFFDDANVQAVYEQFLI